MNKQKRSAFTLIELLVVIAIIGILAAIALSATNSAKKRANDARIKTRVADLFKGWISYSSDQSLYQDACVSDNVLTTANVTGSPSLQEDLLTGEEISASLDATGIYISSSPANACTYASSQFTADAFAVGAQLTANVAVDSANNTYIDGSTGSAVDGLFDTPTLGSGVWFVKVQK